MDIPPLQILGNYMIGKLSDKYYIFYVRASLGGVLFSQINDEFHTIEDAHLYLLEMAKEKSMPDNTMLIVEVAKNYMLIAQYNTPSKDVQYEIGIKVNDKKDSK